MIKCVLTFVSGVQESVLVDFISQSKVKILHQSKFAKIVFIKNFVTKTNKFIFLWLPEKGSHIVFVCHLCTF